MNRKQIGELGENLAADFLIGRGYEILTRNYHSQFGEIDLIAKKSGLLSFVEVKTRTSHKFGLAEDSINRAKKDKIYKTIQDYIYKEQPELDWRFEIIAIDLNMASHKAQIRHYPGVALS